MTTYPETRGRVDLWERDDDWREPVLLSCPDCSRPTVYDYRRESYIHADEPCAACFITSGVDPATLDPRTLVALRSRVLRGRVAAMLDRPGRAAWRWHLAHSGGAEPLSATALALARAERWLEDRRGWLHVEWDDDPDGAADGEHPAWSCAIYPDEGPPLAALGGIDAPPGDDYRRTVEAELAVEARAALARIAREAGDVLRTHAAGLDAAATSDLNPDYQPDHLAHDALLRAADTLRADAAEIIAGWSV